MQIPYTRLSVCSRSLRILKGLRSSQLTSREKLSVHRLLLSGVVCSNCIIAYTWGYIGIRLNYYRFLVRRDFWIETFELHWDFYQFNRLSYLFEYTNYLHLKLYSKCSIFNLVVYAINSAKKVHLQRGNRGRIFK